MHTHLNRVQTFLAVVDFGSYTKAANYLSISKAMASLHVKALEDVLSATLLIEIPEIYPSPKSVRTFMTSSKV